MENIKHEKVIAIALRGITMMPGAVMHFDVSRKKSIVALERAMGESERVFLVTQKDEDIQEPTIEDLYPYGTYSVVKQIVKLSQGNIRVMVEGIKRYRLIALDTTKEYLEAKIIDEEKLLKNEIDVDDSVVFAMVRIIKEQIREYALSNMKFSKESLPFLMEIEGLPELIYRAAADISFTYQVKQSILDCQDIEIMYELFIKELLKENQIVKIKQEFQSRLKENIDQNQKEYFLREQLKIIQKELGDNNPFNDALEYERKLESIKLDKTSKEKLKKEIGRLKSMPGGSQESNVIRSYLDTVFDLPWKKYSTDNKDIKYSKQILDSEHYGLFKLKERVLEYLSVRTLNPKGHGPILCLVGPPGTGKTSIARSIAKALDKKYVRISLGGVRDEAEIRGHRKTYVGAMPGRIVDGLRQAKVSNPLMLLDEIDKVSSDYKGDTSSALLEVLDVEQNFNFRDHYIELPIDLSQVLFIATANSITTIPTPLLDRMEIIEVSSYTENEKFHIAKDYLLEKQMKENGIVSSQVSLSDSAIKRIIHNYTREAGVRNLERLIGQVYRKCARKILEGHNKKILISEANINKYLGKEKVNFDKANEKDDVGIVRGLAWTRVGGDTLQIEVNIMHGKGALSLTGQMGDVMKESAQTALSCIRAIADDYKIDKDFFNKYDIHLHIPEGAVPKDGPSAGIAMATAMLSAITGIKIRKDVAMTGEITLRGRVLAIGGLKEKLLAAKMADIKIVIVPERNRVDVEELSKEITGGLEIVFVNEFSQVLKKSLVEV